MAEELGSVVPDQPDGIDSDSHDLPEVARAAVRVGAYLSEFGDGLVDVGGVSVEPDAYPLYARDLQALVNAVSDARRRMSSREMFAATMGYQAGESDTQLLRWLHAEAVWELKQARVDLEDGREGFQSVTDALQRAYSDQGNYLRELEEEAYRLRCEVQFEALGGVGIDGGAHSRDNLRHPLCACLTADQKAQLHAVNEATSDGPQWSLPLCAVHPEADR